MQHINQCQSYLCIENLIYVNEMLEQAKKEEFL